MKIAPISSFKPNICSKGKTFAPKNEEKKHSATQKPVVKDIPKELAAIQALNGFGFSNKKSLSVDELAEYVEHSINSGLEEKLLEYHKIVLDAHTPQEEAITQFR